MTLSNIVKLRTILNGAIASVKTILNANANPDQIFSHMINTRLDGIMFTTNEVPIVISLKNNTFVITEGADIAIFGSDGSVIDWEPIVLDIMTEYIDAHLVLAGNNAHLSGIVTNSDVAFDGLAHIAQITKQKLNIKNFVRATLDDDNNIVISAHSHIPMTTETLLIIGFDRNNQLICKFGESNMEKFDFIGLINDTLGLFYTAN